MARRWQREDAELAAFLDAHKPVASRASLAVGTTVDSWRLAAFLGRGGSAEVYRAVHVSLPLAAAVKILVRDDATARARFDRESGFLQENGCASFPRCLGAGEYCGRPFVVMELLEPMELPHDDRGVAKYILSVAGAMLELHARGMVHRDLKPQNIMRRKDGEPVIIDFGLLKPIARDGRKRVETITAVGGRSAGVGTPGYAAPEQLMGDEVSPATDVHALGVLLNECFDGSPPRRWARIVRRATSSIPEQRYRDVAEFMRAVRARRRPARILAAVLLTALIAAGAVVVWRRVEADRVREAAERRALEEKIQMEHDEIQEMLQRDIY